MKHKQLADSYLFTPRNRVFFFFEASRFSASQAIPRILWKPKVLYRLSKHPRSVRIRSAGKYIN